MGTDFMVALALAFNATVGGGILWTQQSPTEPAAVAESAVLVGAGDIARCEMIGGAEATARLLDRIEGTVFTVGDHAYESGSAKQFQDCYEPTWGRHKARTRPSPGNHDYLSSRGRSYYDYFGDSAGPAGLGYYSYNAGAWHVVSLNSESPAGAKSDQVKWLRADLEANRIVCTLAYWHSPVFSSGAHGNDPLMQEVWKVLYEFGADIVVNGHDHIYERFAPQDYKGKADPERGIRQFIAGTGGAGVYHFQQIRPNSEVRDNSTYGVLKFTLAPTSYEWEFVPSGNSKFQDSGRAPCVDLAPKP